MINLDATHLYWLKVEHWVSRGDCPYRSTRREKNEDMEKTILPIITIEFNYIHTQFSQGGRLTMMQKRHIALILALAVCAALLLTACAARPASSNVYRSAPDSKFGENYNPNDTWAIYWYICGSALETGHPGTDGDGNVSGGKASEDLGELMQVSLPKNVTVVIETGGTKIWQTPGIAAGVNSRYVYDSDGLKLVETLPQSDMSDSATVESFLRFCNDNYPADHRGVIFWDHGGGSIKGVIFDEYSGRSMKLPELRKAFEAVCTPSEDDPPYEFVGFDACLMATIDVAEKLNGVARWMIASEEFEPGCGWNYRFMQNLADSPGLNGGHLGKAVCDAFYSDCVARNVAADVTMSLINLTHVGGLLEAYAKVGTELFSKVSADQSNLGLLERSAMKAENYGGNNGWDGYMNMVDLGDFTVKTEASGLLEKYPPELYSALNDCVIYQVKGSLMGGANGLSCYYNYNGDRSEFDRFAVLKGDNPFRWLYHYRLYQQMPEAGMAYMKSMETKYGLQVLDAPPFEISGAGLSRSHARVTSEDGTLVAELNIGHNDAEELADVHMNLICPDGDDGALTTFGTDYLIHDDWANGVFYDAFPAKWAAIDGVFIYLEIKESSGYNIIYDVPVLLNSERYTLIVGYLFETGEYEIEGARHLSDEDRLPPKELRKIVPGDVIEPLFHRIDAGGTGAWDPAGRVTVTEATCIEDTILPDGTYYLTFTMTDILERDQATNVIEVNIDGGEMRYAGY